MMKGMTRHATEKKTQLTQIEKNYRREKKKKKKDSEG